MPELIHQKTGGMKEKLRVIKIGGNIIDDLEKLEIFLNDFASIPTKKILVHGGGKLATQVAEAIGIPQQLVEGRRITDADTLKVVTMVYAGYINKNIVAGLQKHQCAAIGLTGADGSAVLAHKRKADSTIGKQGLDYGFAGDIDRINTPLIVDLITRGLTPILAPITHDGKGQLLNTNADTLASEIAAAMAEHFDTRLLYCFEKKGVLEFVEDENSVIPLITPSVYEKLKADQKLFEGMIPKIDNTFAAIRKGVPEVIIGHAADVVANSSSATHGTLIKGED